MTKFDFGRKWAAATLVYVVTHTLLVSAVLALLHTKLDNYSALFVLAAIVALGTLGGFISVEVGGGS